MSAPIGQLTERVDVLNITNDVRCSITTDGDHGFTSRDFIRLTGLGVIGENSPAHGSDELNNKKFRIIVTASDTFFLQDPITFDWIDSTNYPPYVSGGSCNLVQPTFIYYPSEDQEFPN